MMEEVCQSKGTSYRGIKDNNEYYWYIGYSYIEAMLAAEIYIVSLSAV